MITTQRQHMGFLGIKYVYRSWKPGVMNEQTLQAVYLRFVRKAEVASKPVFTAGASPPHSRSSIFDWIVQFAHLTRSPISHQREPRHISGI